MRSAKVDDNQPEIVGVLRKLGCSVQPLHDVGRGVPDLLVGLNGQTHCVEIKDGSKPPSKRRLTSVQKEWHESWRGSVCVIETVEQAVDWVEQKRRAA